MRNINVVQIGLGTVGRAVTKALVGKGGLQIVGALDIDEGKLGRDLGEVAGLPAPTGVKVERDAEALFAAVDADIVVHTACSLLHEAWDHLVPALRNGVDIVSATEELGNAYAADPGLAARLDRLARDNGATVLGTGLSPGWSSDYLILAASAVCVDVRCVRYQRVGNASTFLNSIVGKHFGLGLSAADFKKGVESGEIIGHVGFIESAHVLADRLGWRFDRLERVIEPTHAPDGRFLSSDTIVRGYRGGELALEFSMQALLDPQTVPSEHISIEADPPLDIMMKPPGRGIQTTAHALVNAIPHVINAEPGLIVSADLPMVHAFEGDVRRLLRSRPI